MKQKSLFLAIAVLLGLRITTTAQTPPAYVPTDGLVGWWPFNGNANDESGNGNNGTVNGATLTEDRFGNGNAAYSYDGSSQYIEILDSPSLNPTSISISGWINASAFATNVEEGSKAIITKWFQIVNCNGQGDNYNVLLSIQENENRILGVTSINNAAVSAISSNPVSLNTWNHFVFVHDENEGESFYLNGNLINQNSMLGALCPTLNNLLFGADNAFSNYWRFFAGSLDDFGIWNRALTQEEITELYNANLCYEYITVTDTLIINLGPTGFNPVTYSNTILMYPNPSNDQLTIDYGDYATLTGYALKIFNSIGQEIHAANISQQQEVLPLGTWGGAGNYQVVIYNAQGVPVDTRTIVLQ